MVGPGLYYRLTCKCGYMDAPAISKIRCSKDFVHVEASYSRTRRAQDFR